MTKTITAIVAASILCAIPTLASAATLVQGPICSRMSPPFDPSLAQEEASEDDTPIPADQVNKYIAVYAAMQRDHSVTVDQAASKQGLSVAQFRDLEDRIERNPVVHEHVMESLKSKTAAAQSGSKKKPQSGSSQ